MNEDEESFKTISTILEESETIEPKYEVPGSHFLLGLHLHGTVGGPELGAAEIEDEGEGTQRIAIEADLGELLEAGGVFVDWEEECVWHGDGLTMEPVN
ncbi:hypothetical protein CRG98_005153 [Punica granatum]|uniref:Uncharacterized protein n=1 Tax=Punica granatum TaxID=22663 RepID=A0A2I0L182_PUNGR|nr:hypothetical protein CRG98_005153 [Punica granatum]